MTTERRDTRLRLSGSAARTARAFDLHPDAATRTAIARELDLSALRKLRLSGTLSPAGGRDWALDAMLGATVVQPCGVTLAPVTTRIDEPVRRRYVEMPGVGTAAEEQEMPEDTETEPLPDAVDLDAVMIEALSLAIPSFPRAEAAAPVTATAMPEGAEPIEEDENKPFAGLDAALKRTRS